MRCLQWVAQQNQLFVGCADKSITIWQINQNKQFSQTAQVQALGDVWCMKIVGPYLFAGVQVQQPQICGLIQVWNMQSGKEYKLLKNGGPSHAKCVFALEANAASGILFSGGGDMAIGPQSDPAIRAWKMNQDQSDFELIGEMQGHKAGVKTLQLVGDNKFLISGSFDGQLGVWNANDGSQLSIVQAHQGHVYTVTSMLVDGNYFLMSAGADGNINVYKILQDGKLNGEMQKQHGMRPPITVLSLTVSTKRLIVGFSSGDVKIFDMPSFNNAGFWKPHQGEIFDIITAQNINGFISASGDKKFSCFYFK